MTGALDAAELWIGTEVDRVSSLARSCLVLRAARVRARIALALELAHGYLRPIAVDNHVGLLAAVGEGMQGKPGVAGRIFTAISRVQVNIIAIAQGSSELTIAVVVRRDGLENAVRAVHAECGLGRRPPAPVFPQGRLTPRPGGRV